MCSRKPPNITDDTPIGPDVDLKRDNVRLKDGTRLTDEVVSEIVDQLRRSAGRPPCPGRQPPPPRSPSASPRPYGTAPLRSPPGKARPSRSSRVKRSKPASPQLNRRWATGAAACALPDCGSGEPRDVRPASHACRLRM